jgi:hypothetical protein
MTNKTLQGGDSYPSHLAGINGEQLRGRQFKSAELKIEYDSTREKKNTILENIRRREVQDEDNSEGFGIQKELSV